jgi:hypothetical protein
VNETTAEECDLCGAEDDVIEEPCEEPGYSVFVCAGCRAELATSASPAPAAEGSA